jgi:hypothetical protein
VHIVTSRCNFLPLSAHCHHLSTMVYTNGTVSAAFKMNCTNSIRLNITYYRLQCVHGILQLCSNDIIIIVIKVLPKYNRFQTDAVKSSDFPTCPSSRWVSPSHARGCAVNDDTSASLKSVVSDEIKLEGIILNLWTKTIFHISNLERYQINDIVKSRLNGNGMRMREDRFIFLLFTLN